MSEPDPVEEKEAVVKGRFEKLADAVDAFGSETRDADQEIEKWSRRIGKVTRARAVARTTPAGEKSPVEAEEAKREARESAEGEPGVSKEEEREGGSSKQEEIEAGPQWYFVSGGQRKGPMAERDLRRLLKSERLPVTTPVWTKGQGDWAGAAETGLVNFEVEEAPPRPRPEAAPEVRAEKDCPGCRVVNRASARFCRACRHSLAGVEAISRVRKVACPSCRVPVNAEARFCLCCGTRLGS